MKIVSWDVGIKNLAYCLIESTDDKEKPYIIHEWNVINIIDEDLSCCYESCENKTIKTFCSFMGEHKYFCKEHKTYHKVILNKWNKIKEDIIGENGLCITCNKKSKWLFNNNKYCTIHKNSLVKKFDKEIDEKKYAVSKIKSVSVDDTKLALINKLDQNLHLLDVDEVCIENQPSFKNPRMKSISDTIYTWFLIRGKVDRNIKNIHFISPSNKLKITGKEVEINKEIKESTNKYKTTKQLSIKHCKEILKYNQDYIDKIDNYSKADDLCDTCLQGIYFFNNYKKYI